MGFVLLNQRSELVQILTKIVRGGASVLQLSNRMLREDKYDAGNSVFILRVVTGCSRYCFCNNRFSSSSQLCWYKRTRVQKRCQTRWSSHSCHACRRIRSKERFGFPFSHFSHKQTNNSYFNFLCSNSCKNVGKFSGGLPHPSWGLATPQLGACHTPGDHRSGVHPFPFTRKTTPWFYS